MTSVWLADYVFYAIFLLIRIRKSSKKCQVEFFNKAVIPRVIGYHFGNLAASVRYFSVNYR